jgi:RNA polymerase sigma-70 factor (ECF subfamily)
MCCTRQNGRIGSIFRAFAFFLHDRIAESPSQKKFFQRSNEGLNRLLRRFSPQLEKRPTVTKEVRRGLPELLPRLRRFSYALTGNPDRGDDLVQETCVRALARADQWQPGTRLDSWMFKIMHNLWIDQKRASKVRGTIVEMNSLNEPVGEDGRKTVDRRLTLARVLAAMEMLPKDQRVVLALVCVEELSYQETAALLKIPIGTVMSRLSRARRFLHAKAIQGPATLEANHGRS